MHDISHYKHIILDCDGVILNSNKLKTLAFRKTLSSYDKNLVDSFINYHTKNGGISRYVKFNYFLKNILKKKEYQDEYLLLIKRFKKLLLNDLIKSKVDSYLIDFFKKNKSKSFYVLSGGDEEELKYVFKKKKLIKYFHGIYGSPKDKETIIKKFFLDKISINKSLFIGDSELDYIVSKKFGIDFIFKYQWTEFHQWRKFVKLNKINSIKNFKDFINN